MVEPVNKQDPLVLIMAGGSGTRFWPVSQRNFPKQFLKLFGSKTLIETTVERAQGLAPLENIIVCGLRRQEPLFKQFLPNIQNWVWEPESRNTAACIMLSVSHLLKSGISPTHPLIVLPADHFVGTPEKLNALLKEATAFASISAGLLTLGITPSAPHTGYGYIQAQHANANFSPVAQFIEKPNHEKAEKLLEAGNCFWNAGIFIWTLEAISKAFKKWTPDTWAKIHESNSSQLDQIYTQLKSEPIDKAILEKAENVYVAPAPIEWNDVGSWDAVYELNKKPNETNVNLSGHVETIDTEGCLVQVPPDTKVGLVGVRDLVIVAHEGRILITARTQDQKVRELSKALEAPQD